MTILIIQSLLLQSEQVELERVENLQAGAMVAPLQPGLPANRQKTKTGRNSFQQNPGKELDLKAELPDR